MYYLLKISSIYKCLWYHKQIVVKFDLHKSLTSHKINKTIKVEPMNKLFKPYAHVLNFYMLKLKTKNVILTLKEKI